MGLYTGFCKFGGKFKFLVEKDIKTSAEFKTALRLLKWNITPEEVIAASRLFLILSTVLLGVAALFLQNIYLFVIGIVLGVVGAHVITEYPKEKIRSWALNALSHFPSILIQIVVNLKQRQNLENAISFAAKYGEGDVAKDIRKYLKQVWMGKRINLIDVLNDLADKWGKFAYGIKRSIYLIVSSFSEKTVAQRMSTLDRAVRVSLESIRDKTKEYASELVLPTMFLFSIGTIIPLVIISILPVFIFFGAAINTEILIIVILSASLLFVFLYSTSILQKRPVSFTPIKIPDNVKGVPKKYHVKIGGYQINAFLYSMGVFLVIATPGLLFTFSRIPTVFFADSIISDFITEITSLSLIWAIGAAIAVYCYGTAKEKAKIRKDMEILEDELGDTSYQLASRMSEGRSPEEAILFVSKLQESSTSKLLKKTYNLVKNQHLTLEKAFFDRKIGTLKDIYSNNVKSTFRIFINSLKGGTKSAAESLFTLSDHLSELKKIEKRTREVLSKSIAMMKMTATFFAPAICGIVIVLHSLIQQSISKALDTLKELETMPFKLGFLESKADIGTIEIVLGIYIILLLYVLIKFSSIMGSGDDEVNFKLQIAYNMVTALFIYSTILIISKLIVI